MKVVLFDVGDTLVYRLEDDKTIETNFLKQYINSNLENFNDIVSEKYKKYEENLFIKSTSSMTSLRKENDCYFKFVTEIVQDLGLSYFSQHDIAEIAKLRFSICRYRIFDGIYPTLQMLLNADVQIGIATNGKPSRRSVLKALGIDRFINKNLIFISDEMRLKKPDTEFFKAVNAKINRYFKTENQIFLVDDDIENCTIATNFLNWRSLHYYPGINISEEILKTVLQQ